MKMQEHANKLLTNVTDAPTQNFGIGDASVVIEILRNRLYENKIQTLVQEYICNARDAMREVGKKNGFDVTVPTDLNPVFKVRDFGPGITPDRMANVFILYGASTKRGTNNQTGGFGIGAKSAWSYTDSFTIATFIDGTKRSYVAHTGVNNNGRLDLVSTEETDEKNGTEIQVAVKRHDVREFRESVLRAVYFWEEKPALKGQLDMPELLSGYKIGTYLESVEINMLPSYVQPGYGNHLAIIDGVPYTINHKLLDKCKTLRKLTEFIHKTIILHLGNGVVEVSASRESIADSPKTVDNLEKIANKVGLEVKTHISDRFGKVKSPSEYIKVYRELIQFYSIENGFAKYGDYKINNSSIIGDSLKKVKITEIHCLNRRGRTKVKKITRREKAEGERVINLDLFDHAFFVKTKESAVSQNKRIRAYFETHTKMLLIESLPNVNFMMLDKVVSDLGIKDFQTVTYVVLPKEERVKIAREKSEFCMHVLDGDRHQYTTLSDNTEKWLYVPLNDKGWETSFEVGNANKDFTMEQLKGLNSHVKTLGFRICGLAERALKMIDGDKNYSPLSDWLDAWKPTNKEINYVKFLSSTNKVVVDSIKSAKDIKDDELNEIIKEYRSIEKHGIQGLPEMLHVKVAEEKEVKEFVEQDENVAKLIKRTYPLLEECFNGYYRPKQIQEIVYYLNAKFEAK